MVSRRSAPLALLLALCACGGSGAEEAAEAVPPPLVEAVEARSGRLPSEETVHGVVRARNQVVIRPEIEAPVVEVLVRSGEAVRQGQPLVRLQDAELRQRLRQAEADVRLAEAAASAARARVAELEAQVVRARALAEQELISDQELEVLEAQLAALEASADQAEAAVEQARAIVEERRSALEKTVVRAPVAGRLGERRVEVGMLVDPSSLLFVVGDLDELVIAVTLTEAMLEHLEEGQSVRVPTPGSPSEPIPATLSRISPFLEEASFTTVGEIDLENPEGRLRPGMFVEVVIPLGEGREATLLPASAVWEDPASGERGVFVVQESTGLEEAIGRQGEMDEPRAVEFRRVRVEAEGQGMLGVSGVEAGEWVVTMGQHLLRAEMQQAGDDGAGLRARVRPVALEQVAALQALQREDLLLGFLEKQQIIARALGPGIPESEEVVERILQEAGEEPTREVP